jgi:hypothetical protein
VKVKKVKQDLYKTWKSCVHAEKQSEIQILNERASWLMDLTYLCTGSPRQLSANRRTGERVRKTKDKNNEEK